MELERKCNRHKYKHRHKITLFLYGIGANLICSSVIVFCGLHYSYMELELAFLNEHLKLIPQLHYSYMELELIWLSSTNTTPFITLFLYGIGALILCLFCRCLLYYIIPIWNWSMLFTL